MSARRVTVAVLGGGPAGSAAALRLARFGLDVVLFGAGSRDRHHVGESLPSSTLVLLRALGVDLPADSVEERPPEHRVFWGRSEGASTRRHPAGEASLLVWRGPFDRRLLDRAEAAGVEVVRGVRASVRREDEDFLVGGGACEVRARFLVDATGRTGLVSRRSRSTPRFRTLALTAHFRSRGRFGPTLVEAFPEGFAWSAPLRDDLRDVTVFLDANAEPAGVHVEERFFRALERAPAVRGELESRAPVRPVRAIDATPYASETVAGSGFVVAGDAASFLDPLSAHGVHKALDDAFAASAVIRTVTERPESAGDAIRFYQARERDIVRATAGRIARTYASETRFAERPFWRRRSREPVQSAPFPIAVHGPLRGDRPLAAASGVRVEEAPVLENDYIVRREVLRARGGDRPVRFLGSTPLPPVFRAAVSASSAESAVRGLDLPFERAWAAIDWLYRSGYLEQPG